MCMICDLTTTFDPARHNASQSTAEGGGAASSPFDYVIQNFKWGAGVQGTSGGQVNWSFAQTTGSFFSFDRPFSEAEYQALVREAFAAWEAALNIDFVEVADSSSVELRVGWDAIDGAFGTVGTAQYSGVRSSDPVFSITNAEIRFDTAETWNLNKTSGGQDTNFYTVALHEIGHVLGLGHSTNRETIMFASQQDDIVELQSGDITGAQIIYGPAQASTAPPSSGSPDTGNQTFTMTDGNETVDGQGGTDTAVFSIPKGAATVSINANGTITVTDRAGPGGTDTLINIERAQFSDTTMDFTAFSSLIQLSAAQFTQLAEMYVAYFNRAADAEGLYFWADKLAEGTSLNEIAELFFNQPETRALYPNPGDTDAFVTAVYANVLGRTPDPDGFAFWKAQVSSGAVSQGAFVLEIINGAKNGGGANDVAYLDAKADLGLYFSAIKGMSDGNDARQAMNIFGDQATSNTSGAKAAIDGHHSDALAGGEPLFTLVGVVADPLAGVS
ncbi:MAG: matrixin family metalloprotease [Pseudomonadota bacterium]